MQTPHSEVLAMPPLVWSEMIPPIAADRMLVLLRANLW